MFGLTGYISSTDARCSPLREESYGISKESRSIESKDYRQTRHTHAYANRPEAWIVFNRPPGRSEWPLRAGVLRGFEAQIRTWWNRLALTRALWNRNTGQGIIPSLAGSKSTTYPLVTDPDLFEIILAMQHDNYRNSGHGGKFLIFPAITPMLHIHRTTCHNLLNCHQHFVFLPRHDIRGEYQSYYKKRTHEEQVTMKITPGS